MVNDILMMLKMMEYHRNYDVDIRIARIFNTYGPRLNNDGRVVSNFINPFMVMVRILDVLVRLRINRKKMD